jgi:hypothetical protein
MAAPEALRRERRRRARLARLRWARFLRATDFLRGFPPERWTSAKHDHFVARLASRAISWTGSDRWWKHQLRRERQRREAEDFRVALRDVTDLDDNGD